MDKINQAACVTIAAALLELIGNRLWSQSFADAIKITAAVLGTEDLIVVSTPQLSIAAENDCYRLRTTLNALKQIEIAMLPLVTNAKQIADAAVDLTFSG